MGRDEKALYILRSKGEQGISAQLRHLFARCYYEKEKDLVRLADFLGHSSVETTRRYTMISSMEACLKTVGAGIAAE